MGYPGEESSKKARNCSENLLRLSPLSLYGSCRDHFTFPLRRSTWRRPTPSTLCLYAKPDRLLPGKPGRYKALYFKASADVWKVITYIYIIMFAVPAGDKQTIPEEIWVGEDEKKQKKWIIQLTCLFTWQMLARWQHVGRLCLPSSWQYLTLSLDRYKDENNDF